jgi:ATP-binding cassette, subfamily F, member 3
MRSLEARRATLQTRLSDPAVYGGPTRDLMELQVKLAEVKKQIAAAEEQWLSAQGALESGSAETANAD